MTHSTFYNYARVHAVNDIKAQFQRGKLSGYYGSAYSQVSDSGNTPTVDVLNLHFDEDSVKRGLVGEMFRDSWKLLVSGYMFTNVDYMLPSKNDDPVSRIDRLLFTIEFLSTLIIYQYEHGYRKPVSIVAMGRDASYVSYEISKRVKANSVSCTVHTCGQPAQLSRLTYNKHLIGKSDDYQCLTASVKRILLQMTRSYIRVQGTIHQDIRCTMSKKIDSLISSGIRHMSNKAEQLANDTAKELNRLADKSSLDKLGEEVNSNRRIIARQSELIHDLIDLISTNAFVSATISDKIVSSATAGSSKQSIYAAPVSVQSSKPVSTIGQVAKTDDASSVSFIDSFMTPIKAKSEDRKSDTGTKSTIVEDVNVSALNLDETPAKSPDKKVSGADFVKDMARF